MVITEIGGTVGDIESLPFLEAIRQVSVEVGKQNVLYVHVSLVPVVPGSDELKSKPTQHSVKELLSIGIQPDIVVCRAEYELNREIRDKIALFCNIPPECVIQNLTAKTLYEVPLWLAEEGLDDVIVDRLKLNAGPRELSDWEKVVSRIKKAKKTVKIAIVGKYIALRDAYLSVAEALHHGGIENDALLDIEWIDSENINDDNAAEILKDCNGILVPGRFGDRE